ncbi:MAG: hypothetical protein Q8838_02915, partial [Candidatus Phytoplasma australasiaticum]|nr:hypothetical protein [Candidatus Phytoplasma australasiaticum]
QNPDYQFIGCDVKHDIAFGLENQNLSREEMQKKIFNRGKGVFTTWFEFMTWMLSLQPFS